jgi:hypothetical protein
MAEIIQLPGTVSSKESLEKMREQLPILIEHMGIMAKLTMAKYNALREEGFSDVQAIELCKVIP